MADTCIIVPCYNEANRIVIADYKSFIDTYTEMDFIFVNDGSNDDTQSILNNLADYSQQFKVLHLTKNTGKAEAIRQGFFQLSSDYKFVGYLDADLSTPLSEIERLRDIASKLNKPFVMGSRIKRIGSKIDRRLKRHVSGRIVATIIDTFFLKLGIYDTQCGAKIIAFSLAKTIFKEPFKTKWLFDVELILRTKLQYGKTYCLENIIEIPLNTWKDIGQSKITPFDVLKLPKDFMTIYKHYL